MILLKFVFVGCILLIGLCSANPAQVNWPDGRIVGGFETSIEENPWQVSLHYFFMHICGGSIIADKWVLTAAHCSSGKWLRIFKVRVGSSSHGSGGLVIKLKRSLRHPKYSSFKNDFDFSLLELAEPLRFNVQVQAIALPDANTYIADGTPCLVSGWGNTQSWDEQKDQLRAAIVPIANQDYCNKQYRGKITPRMICAGYEEGGKDSCQGDSGGPLIDENDGNPRIIGVVSFGSGCAQPKHPGVYARVTSAREWINSVTGI